MASTSKEPETKVSVNLFVEPHNRLKVSADFYIHHFVKLFITILMHYQELVNWPLSEAAKVDDVHDLEPCLQAIYEAMWEMKSHEYIENHYIMVRYYILLS